MSYRIHLAPTDFKIAKYNQQIANKRPSIWNTVSGNFAANVLDGTLAEIAVAKALSTDKFQTKYEDVPITGKDCDLVLEDGTTVEVKTSRKPYNLMIRQTNQSGNRIPLRADLYFLTQIIWLEDSEDLLECAASVLVVGYIEKERLKTYGGKPARKGNHLNYEVPIKDLYDLDMIWPLGGI